MKKYLLSAIILVWMTLIAQPMRANSSTYFSAEPETSLTEIKLAVSGRTVRVSGAEGEALAIYDVAGNLVKELEVDSDDKAFTINTKSGIYIIKVGTVVRKIQVR